MQYSEMINGNENLYLKKRYFLPIFKLVKIRFRYAVVCKVKYLKTQFSILKMLKL